MTTAPLELLPIDLAPYRRGNVGIDYVHRFDSGRDGPRVMVNALTHGNELCGAYALARLLDDGIRPRRGSLTVSFANVAAYERFDVANPTASRFIDEDFNRLWSDAILAGPRHSAELDRARALRPLVAEADLLLDIHSMHADGPALMLCGIAEKGVKLARKLGAPAFIVADRGHDAGPRMRDYGAFSDPALPAAALLVECGQHWRAETRAIAFDTLFRFLAAAGTVSAEQAAPYCSVPPPDRQRLIEVTEVITIATDDFRFSERYAGLEVVATAGTVIASDGDRAITTPYDDCVLVMPAQRLRRGQTAVRLGRLVD